jgi:hypothetical protein
MRRVIHSAYAADATNTTGSSRTLLRLEAAFVWPQRRCEVHDQRRGEAVPSDRCFVASLHPSLSSMSFGQTRMLLPQACVRIHVRAPLRPGAVRPLKRKGRQYLEG